MEWGVLYFQIEKVKKAGHGGGGEGAQGWVKQKLPECS